MPWFRYHSAACLACILTLTHDKSRSKRVFDFQSQASYGHDPYTNTKTRVQRSVGSKDRVETNGRTDGQTDGRTDATNCFNCSANAVGKIYCSIEWDWRISLTWKPADSQEVLSGRSAGFNPCISQYRDVNNTSSVQDKTAKPRSRLKVIHVQSQGHFTKANTDTATKILDSNKPNKALYFCYLFLF